MFKFLEKAKFREAFETLGNFDFIVNGLINGEQLSIDNRIRQDYKYATMYSIFINNHMKFKGRYYFCVSEWEVMEVGT